MDGLGILNGERDEKANQQNKRDTRQHPPGINASLLWRFSCQLPTLRRLSQVKRVGAADGRNTQGFFTHLRQLVRHPGGAHDEWIVVEACQEPSWGSCDRYEPAAYQGL